VSKLAVFNCQVCRYTSIDLLVHGMRNVVIVILILAASIRFLQPAIGTNIDDAVLQTSLRNRSILTYAVIITETSQFRRRQIKLQAARYAISMSTISILRLIVS